MPIRILHVVEALGVGGGVETGIGNLIANMDSDRFEHVLCAVFRVGTQMERYPLARVQIVPLEQRSRRFSVQVGPLARTIRRIKPTIIHSRNWGALEAVIAGRWAGSCSVIHSEHGVEMNPVAEPRRRSWLRRTTFHMAHRVFSVSHQLRDMLAQNTGFPARKISVIHNGVDMNRFRKDSSSRALHRESLGIAADEFCLGCVGRLNHIKDYPTLLRAAEIFGKACSSWRLLIVGEGTERSELERMVQESAMLSGRVRFLGTSRRIPEFLNALDCYVLPSICEGISNSLLEAMSAGVPVVASRTGGNPEVAVDGESGLLFSVGDSADLASKLLLVWNSPAQREKLTRESVRRVREQFSLASMVRQYEDMYEKEALRFAPLRAAATATAS